MSQKDGTPPPSSTSTFPLSSPSFWTEAAAVALPSPPPIKRPRNDLSSPQSDYTELLEIEEKPEIKRGRYDSPSTSKSTTLSYLPKRSDFLVGDDSDPHSYLANAEYAPNKFGDIGDYMRKKEIKVQTQNRDLVLSSIQNGIYPQIFKGLSFYINGNTQPPMEEIRKLILQRGGEVRPVLRNKGMVKFIIAPMLTQSKFKQFQNYKVVREDWIIQSCKEGKLLDWTKWKLQILGGWEESSRKGLEGFLKSQQTPSQQIQLDQSQDPELKDEPEEEILQSIPKDEAIKPVPPNKDLTTLPTIASSIRLSSATQPLLAPYRATTIPISPKKSPGLARIPSKQGSPSPVPLPAKIQKPEGAWENYYTKESNENAALAMKNDQWRAKNTAERGNEGGFIDGYYQNSRLHHLATWKSELKVLVADAQRRSEELSLSTPSSNTLAPFSLANSALPSARNMSTSTSNSGEKVIFHVDFDCFFVSCGLATRPELKGKPTVVCHSQLGKIATSTSEIASCSYEARAKGVKNGMSLGRAKSLVGDELETIPYEFETYKKYSLAFYTVLMGYADELQAVSVDEALIDVTSAVNARAMAPEEASEGDAAPDDLNDERGDTGDAMGVASKKFKRIRDPAVEVAEKIRDEVRKLTDGCEVSIGISHNILLAKLATRSAKPAGVAHFLHSDIEKVLAGLDVEDFPSIGYSIKTKIKEKFGTSNVAGLLNVNKLSFQRVLGPKTGEMLFNYLRGIDERVLEPDKVRKSVSAEMNYGIRFQNQDQAEICVNDLAHEVAKRMKNVGVKGRQITLKLMKRHPDAPIEPPKFMGHGWCEAFNRSSQIAGPRGGPTDDPGILGRESVKLLRALNLDPVELRGVGVQITKLDTEDKTKVKEREAGQGVLGFQPKGKQKIVDEKEIIPTIVKTDDSIREDSIQPEPEKQKTRSPSIPLLPQSRSPSIEESVSRSPTPQIQPEAGPSHLPIPLDDEEGIDPSFLAALPLSLQEEVRRDFAQSRAQAQTRASRATSEKLPSNIPNDEKAGRATTVSPIKKHAAAHITRQLRPKLKTQLKVNQLSDRPLFSAWNKAQDKAQLGYEEEEDDDIVDLTRSDPKSIEDINPNDGDKEIGGYKISELNELGIDSEVFQALPQDMRKEIIKEERIKSGRRRILTKPGNGFSREGSISRGRNISNSISPIKAATSYRAIRNGSLPPLGAGNGQGQGGKSTISYITIKPPNKPALFKSTEIEDILGLIEKWIESRNGSGPALKDSEKVKNWLIKSITSSFSSSSSTTTIASGGGIGGIERCIETIRFMRTILREKYPLQEEMILHKNDREGNEEDGRVDEEEEEEGDEIENKAGKEWWLVWKDYEDEIQSRAKKLMGAELKI